LDLKTGFKSSWEKAGYRKKSICEKCGFKSKHPAQMDVYHIDGNLKNASWHNLKTICANCGRIKAVEEIGWKQGSLIADKL
jgi:ribosomal protein L37E